MTKKEIVKTISDEMNLTQLKTKEIVQKTFDAIVETLVTEGRIELRNFGVFEVKKRAARKARNPRTGERVDVDEKFVVTFKPGKEMEERVRQLELEAAARRREEQAASENHAQSTPEPANAYSTSASSRDLNDSASQDGAVSNPSAGQTSPQGNSSADGHHGVSQSHSTW